MSREALERLARKYRELVALHRALARWDDETARGRDRALAAEFPGALRELQTLDEETLRERLFSVEEALAGRAPALPWMGWMDDRHRLLVAALAIRRRCGRRALDDAEAARVAAEVAREVGVRVDGPLAQALARPAHGRLADVVTVEVARRHAVSPAAVDQALHPRRRRS